MLEKKCVHMKLKQTKVSSHHGDAAPSGEWTPSGCCSQTEMSVDVCAHIGPQIFCQYALLPVDICAYLAACEFVELCVLFVRKRCMAYWLSSSMLGQFHCLASLWLIELLEAQSPFGPVCVASLQLTELLAVLLHIGSVCLPGFFTASRAVGRPVASVLKCKC